MINFPPLTYVAGGLAALSLALGVAIYFQGQKIDRLEGWQRNVTAITSSAADVRNAQNEPAQLSPNDVAAQIVDMGASIQTLRSGLQTCRRNAEQRATALIAARQRAEQRREQLAEQYRGARASIVRLRQIANDATNNPNPQCQASSALLRELEGLQQ